MELLSPRETLSFLFLAHDGDEEIRRRCSEKAASKPEDVRKIVEERMQFLRETELVQNALSANPPAVAAVRPLRNPPRDRRQRHQLAVNPRHQVASTPRRFRPRHPDDLRGRCARCAGPQHRQEECQVFLQGLTCHFCRRAGHISPACLMRLRGLAGDSGAVGVGAIVPTDNDRSLGEGNNATDDSDSEDDDGHPEVTPRLPVYIRHPGGKFLFDSFPDSGSGVALISSDLAKQYRVPINPTADDFKLIAVNGSFLRVAGRVVATVSTLDGLSRKITFRISPDLTREVILGYRALKKLQIVQQNFPVPIRSINKADLNFNSAAAASLHASLCAEFDGVLDGCLPKSGMDGDPMRIYLNNRTDILPTRVSTARSVPLHFQRGAEDLVDKLLKEGIIAKVNVPTEWCSPAFFVRKPSGGLRLVTDFSGLNRRICRPRPPLPRPARHRFRFGPRFNRVCKSGCLVWILPGTIVQGSLLLHHVLIAFRHISLPTCPNGPLQLVGRVLSPLRCRLRRHLRRPEASGRHPGGRDRSGRP